jgi:hypothetical protein
VLLADRPGSAGAFVPGFSIASCSRSIHLARQPSRPRPTTTWSARGGGAHDQDRGSQEGKRSHRSPSGGEGLGQDQRQPGPGLGQIQYLDEGGIDLFQIEFRKRPTRATPCGQPIRGAATASQDQDAAPRAETMYDVQQGNGATRRRQHEAAVPGREMLGHVRDPGRFVAPALARDQEEMGVIGVEGDLGVPPRR